MCGRGVNQRGRLGEEEAFQLRRSFGFDFKCEGDYQNSCSGFTVWHWTAVK